MPKNNEEEVKVEVEVEIPEALLKDLDLLITLKKDKYPDRSKAINEAIGQLIKEDKELMDILRKKED